MKHTSPRTSTAPRLRERLRDRLREATTGAILAAAEQVVTEQGVEGARIDEIARRAGVAVGTVYNYFADREALFAAMHDALKAELLAAMDEALATVAGRPFREQLVAVLRAVLTHAERHRQFIAQVMSVDQLAGRARLARTAVITELYDRVEALTNQGVREGVLEPSHAEFYPAMLFAMWRSAMMVQLQRKRPTPLTDLVEPVAHLFLHGAATTTASHAPDAPSSPSEKKQS